MLIYPLLFVQLSVARGAFSCCNYERRSTGEQPRLFSRQSLAELTAVPKSTDVNQSKASKLQNISISSSLSVSSSSTTEQERFKIELQTLSRIGIPSLILASICFATFPTIASTLATNIHDAYDGGAGPNYYGAESLNLILNDNSNQFIQNMHNFCALLFSLLTGYTFAFVYRQQEKVYYALFEEVSAVTSLLEQIALATEGRSALYHTLLESMRAYVHYDMKMQFTPASNKTDTTASTALEYPPEDIPALLLSTRPSKDPFETILYITSVGTPSRIYSTVRQLRQSRSRRLAAMQRKMPELNLYLLYILGFMAWITFPIVAAGSSTVGGDALLNVQRVQLSLGVFAMGGVLGIINELKVPALNGKGGSSISSVYDVDFSVLETLLNGLEDEICVRIAKCDEKDSYADGKSYDTASGFLARASLLDGGSSDGHITCSDAKMNTEDDQITTKVNMHVTPENDIQVTDYVTKPRLFRRILNRIQRRQN